MKSFKFIFIAILVSSLGAMAPCLAMGSASSLQPMTATASGWVLQADFSDEFNSQVLDNLKWKNDVGSWKKNWSWRAENVSVNNGLLTLTMKYHPHKLNGKDIYYTSGIIMNRKPILYGYFEARIKGASLYPGVCPAFWAWHREKNQWTEIDFAELTEQPKSPNFIDTNTHVFYSPDLPHGQEIHERRIFKAPWDPREDFHIYGCEWDADQIRWYIDGKLVATRDNIYWHQPLDLTISLGLRPPLAKTPTPVGLPTSFEVDYVRVWQNQVSP